MAAAWAVVAAWVRSATSSATFWAADAPPRAPHPPRKPAIRSAASLADFSAAVRPGGLGALLEQFEAAGRGDAAQSWVTTGANKPLSARDIEETFGSGVIDMIAEKVGMPKNELLQGLSEAMPRVIDELTPEGHLPTYEELARRR
ncbi:MAG: YidB family protein [Pseudorhodoplanes sp.]|nr:YidB family protein [Pseudorhodoplanes sp.]